MRAAEGHGCRRHPERVFPALQGHRACRDQPRQYLAGLDDPAVLVAAAAELDPGAPETSLRLRGRARGPARRPTASSAAKIMWSHTPTCGRGWTGGARGRLRAAALRAGRAPRQGRAGRLAVDGDPDAGAGAPSDGRRARAGLLVRGDPPPRRLAGGGRARMDAWLRGRDPDVVVYEDFARDPAPTIAVARRGPGARAAPLRRQSGARSRTSGPSASRRRPHDATQ